MKIKERTYSGTTLTTPREYEARHRETARRAAADGIVLLKNEGGVLPLKKGAKVALYGAGTVHTIKGGTGSGDVNVRETVCVADGMRNAGFVITNEDWIGDYRRLYDEAHIAWRQQIWDKMDAAENSPYGLFGAYMSTPFILPAGAPPEKTGAEAAFYVIARTAGEGADRKAAPGDYYLTPEEEESLRQVCAIYDKVVLVLNVGGVVDLSVLDREPSIKAVVLMHQAGMESGSALADVVSGDVTPSGKLTDTWALRYEDYPSADTFSYLSGDVTKEHYKEGIYVGYRWFDAFGIPARYGFGFGLSYAEFSLEPGKPSFDGGAYPDGRVTLPVKVANTSGEYSGREVVQIYAACPQEGMEKELRRLVSFGKTKLLSPGESETLEISFPLRALASYDGKKPGWILGGGDYVLLAGNSLMSAAPAAVLKVSGEVLERTENICRTELPFEEAKPEAGRAAAVYAELLQAASGCPALELDLTGAEDIVYQYDPAYDSVSGKAAELVESLSEEQLVLLSTGEVSKGQGSTIGAAGISVPGSAAETGACAKDNGLAEIVLADGPAGIRLAKQYYVSDDGSVRPTPFELAVEEGFLFRGELDTSGTPYYQYCTAIPVGTLLAQTWDPETVAECGRLIAEEMVEFGVTLWLAPGMNIHRNPLCGRNFEYFSEDPVLSGLMAAAMTKGVQETKGCGTTIKHFACNNQEDNRTGSDSILSERALREIYLRGFEIAVRESQPMSLMTSYNLVNGVHAANSYDLCTKALRNEWGFTGLVMTDWGTTNRDESCTAAGCMRAGNDVVMPGRPMDHDNVRAELADGRLDIRDLKRSVGRLADAVFRSLRYEEE